MAPAALLTLAAALAAAGPLPGRTATPEETALSSATWVYKAALDKYNAFVMLNGSVQDDEAKALYAAKEAARRAMLAAEKAVGRRHEPLPATDGPIASLPVQTAPARPEPAPSRASRRRRFPVMLAVGAVGSALFAWGGVGWLSRRPRLMPCPGCKVKLKAPARGVKTRCPKCKKVFTP